MRNAVAASPERPVLVDHFLMDATEVDVDAIRDERGRYLVHDVNLRVWGAFFASRSAGYDLTGAYLRWLSDQVRCLAGDAERSARVFPDYADTLWGTGRRDGLRPFVEQLRDYRRLLGSRYVAREVLHSARTLVRGLRHPRDDPGR